jgi:hypothetical protein
MVTFARPHGAELAADGLTAAGYGWDRTRLDGRQGASLWCGHGVFAHNLVKISALAS